MQTDSTLCIRSEECHCVSRGHHRSMKVLGRELTFVKNLESANAISKYLIVCDCQQVGTTGPREVGDVREQISVILERFQVFPQSTVIVLSVGLLLFITERVVGTA